MALTENNKFDVERLRDIQIRTVFFNKQSPRRVIHVPCPFHKEKTASLALYSDNTFHCFGCTKHGRGAIDFLVALGADFKTACEELQKYL